MVAAGHELPHAGVHRDLGVLQERHGGAAVQSTVFYLRLGASSHKGSGRGGEVWGGEGERRGDWRGGEGLPA